MDTEMLKAKAGAEHQRRVAEIEARHKNEREDADKDYERKLATINALTVAGIEGLAEFMEWAGAKKAALKSATPVPTGSVRDKVINFVSEQNGNVWSLNDVVKKTGNSAPAVSEVIRELKTAGQIKLAPKPAGAWGRTLFYSKV